jgi:DNA-binding Lrp family transcriptional regulator
MVGAYILIQTDIQQQAAVAAGVRDIPGTGTVDVVTGPYDVVARVTADDNDALGRLVLGSIQRVPKIIRTLTCTIVDIDDG